MQEDDVVDLSSILGTLWRKKSLIFASVIFFAVLGVFYAFAIATPKYQATSVIQLDVSGEQLLDITAVLPSLGADSEAINTEVEVIKSRRLLERVVTQAKLMEDPEFNAFLNPPSLKSRIKGIITGTESPAPHQSKQLNSVINATLDRISVRNVPNTYVLQVTVETENAQKSAEIADTIAKQYILYQLDVKFEATKDASEWLTTRVADLKVNLEQAESQVAEFSANSEVLSLETVQVLERQLKEARERFQALRRSLEEDNAHLETLRAAATGTAEDKLDAANDTRLASLFQSAGEGTAFDARFDQLLTQAAVQAKRTQLQLQALEDSIKVRETDIAKQGDELIQLQQLTREAEASRLLYEHFLSRLKETSAQEGIGRADGRILSYAVLPESASEPRKALILLIMSSIGGMVGCGAILLWEVRKKGYHLALELEADTGHTILGQIPLIPIRNRREALDYLTKKPASATAEAIRNLRTSVLMSNPDKAPQVLMLTSSVPGEGKSLLSFALTQNFVGIGRKTLLIEGDMRRLIFDQFISVKNAKGLMSVLSNEISLKDAVIHDPILKSDILASETSQVNAADILSSKQFEELLKAARDIYDVIIIDTPPVLVVPDARIVSQHADAVLFTIRWGKTTKAQVREALQMFETVGVPVSGLVLNQIEPKVMKEYGQGTYGSYGKEYYTE